MQWIGSLRGKIACHQESFISQQMPLAESAGLSLRYLESQAASSLLQESEGREQVESTILPKHLLFTFRGARGYACPCASFGRFPATLKVEGRRH